MTPPEPIAAEIQHIAPGLIHPNPFSTAIYGNPASEVDGLLDGIREHGILVPLVVHAPDAAAGWELISGHRRLACARVLDLPTVPCVVGVFGDDAQRRGAILEYNRQRAKTFSQQMREADALAELLEAQAESRRQANLKRGARAADRADRRDSDSRSDASEKGGRTDATIAARIGLGGKDLYRQARAIWRTALSGDPRARSGVARLDAGTVTIHAAYKDLRRRDRYAADFRPTPYDVWAFKHDRAFGIPHPGSIPPAIVAHTLHYFSQPGALVVDPMAGGGTTVDVCASMGRRCLAYDLHSVRSDIQTHDITTGFPPEAHGCDLIFADPPYHTMLAAAYAAKGVASAPLAGWIAFLHGFARDAWATLRAGGYLALLVANQTEKGLPVGYGYLDHAFLAYEAIVAAGFLPERRISCPMDGAYLPQHVRQARTDGRMLGQVRDLIVARKPPIPSAARGQPEGRGVLP